MERKILNKKLIRTGYGTHTYDVKYQGEWEDTALINCVDMGYDNPDSDTYNEMSRGELINYGGWVDKIYTDSETGITRAMVEIYYD